MKQIIKTTAFLGMISLLSACGGEPFSGMMGGSIWVSDTGIKGEWVNGDTTVGGFSIDLMLDPDISFGPAQ